MPSWPTGAAATMLMHQDAQFVAFFDGPYREGMDLLESARDYLADPSGDAYADRRSMMQLVVSCETMRLTARLAQITAWLLMQRAVYAGEMAPLEACRPENRLGSPDVCGVPGPWRLADVPLPDRLQDLLDRSLGLYQRIARLDEMVCLRARTIAGEMIAEDLVGDEEPAGDDLAGDDLAGEDLAEEDLAEDLGVSPSDRGPGSAS